jgi:hypothetical protein
MIGSVSDAPEVQAVEQPFQPLLQAEEGVGVACVFSPPVLTAQPETLEQALRTIVLVPSG